MTEKLRFLGRTGLFGTKGNGRAILVITAAMAALASFAIAGWLAARYLSDSWQHYGAHVVTIEVPDTADTDGASRAKPLLKWLSAEPGIHDAHLLAEAEIRKLLTPWLGESAGLTEHLPAIITLTRAPPLRAADLAKAVRQQLPDVAVEENMQWGERLATLGASLQLCAIVVTALAAVTCGCVMALSVLTVLATRRQTVEILHELGATDSMIADRLALQSGGSGLTGGIVGALLAFPALAFLYEAAAPFMPGPEPRIWPSGLAEWSHVAFHLPLLLLWTLLLMPVLTATIGWLAAQISVHLWLRRLP